MWAFKSRVFSALQAHATQHNNEPRSTPCKPSAVANTLLQSLPRPPQDLARYRAERLARDTDLERKGTIKENPLHDFNRRNQRSYSDSSPPLHIPSDEHPISDWMKGHARFMRCVNDDVNHNAMNHIHPDSQDLRNSTLSNNFQQSTNSIDSLVSSAEMELDTLLSNFHCSCAKFEGQSFILPTTHTLQHQRAYAVTRISLAPSSVAVSLNDDHAPFPADCKVYTPQETSFISNWLKGNSYPTVCPNASSVSAMLQEWTTSCVDATFSCTAASLDAALTSFHIAAENADAIFLTKGDAPITATTTKAATDKTDADKLTALALVE